MRKRSLKVIRPWAPGKVGVIRIEVEEIATYYRLREIDCEIGGRGWEVWKLGCDLPFHVRTGESLHDFVCDCIGYEVTRNCRHVHCLFRMSSMGLLISPNETRRKNERADESEIN